MLSGEILDVRQKDFLRVIENNYDYVFDELVHE